MTKKTAALLLALLLVSIACDDNGEGEADPAPRELTGVIVEIDSASLGDVQSFVLQREGERYEILIDDQIDYGFPLGHLNEHRVTADPVLVKLEERDGRLYALSIEDA